MPIKIPKRFSAKLLPEVSSIISNNPLNAAHSILNYFETSPYYFKEYTMHGSHHIEAVLDYADKLIPDVQYKKMTKTAISLLVLGIFLHDLGMFIKESGLQQLLGKDTKEIYNNNDKTNYSWKELWDNYIYELKRAPGNELDELFGEEEHIFDSTSYPVCAGFIRKYHHQIAYHIAIYGFPGKTVNNIFECIKNMQFIKLVGLLAKSHGAALRDLSDEINAFGYDNNLPLNVPIYYLMAILRLADLLDADENRAPKILADMNEFSSSRSKNEWTLNGLIRDRQWAFENGKPETLKIIAFPTTSKQYLELKNWLEYCQKELDLSWAIIGETHQDRFQLSIRRIISNIFNTKYDFVTNAIELKVNPDIVKLLVAPLYGEDPSYGVRELLQNAIDACNERTAIDGTCGEITIDIDENKGLFIISDNGIGMSEDIIANYYLNAGASFRYSKQWIETFSDNENNPKVTRNGRFGIGALATFLIGNNVKVITRNINDIKGYCFEYTIEPKILNVTKIDKPSPGTIIEIVMNPKAINAFTNKYWDSWTKWYHFTKPNIIYKLNGKALKREKMYTLKKGEDSDNWFFCYSNDYDSLHWTFKHYISGNYVCNGIHIPNTQYNYNDDHLRKSLHRRGYYYEKPLISIIDKKGNFPVDLSRKNVLESFNLDDDLVAELCKYQIAKLLVYGARTQCIINKSGFIPKERSFILNIERPIYLIGKPTSTFEVVKEFYQHDIAISYFTADKKLYAKNIKDQIVGEDLACSSIVTEIWVNNTVVEIPKTVGYLPPQNMIHSIDETMSYPQDSPIPISFIGDNVNLIVKYVPSPIRDEENNIMFNVIKELLPKHINGGWIPFEERERETIYCDTYNKLKRYIEPLKLEKNSREKR